MCSPLVMEKVRATVTRRGFVGVAGAAALGLGASLNPVRAARQEATPAAGAGTISLGSFSRIQDLTHVVSPEFPVFPGAKQMVITPLVTIEANGFYKVQLTLDEHTGTHMDAPAHFAPDGLTAEKLPAERFVAPLAVIDISDRASGDPDAQLMPDDILAWEEEYGPLPPGAFVAMYSGWEERLPDAAAFLNQDDGGVPHFPGFHPDAAALLVEERDIVGVGVDTVSLDFGASTDFATHLTVLPANKYGLENLAMLATVPPSGATIIVGGPKHVNASGGPARALALY